MSARRHYKILQTERGPHPTYTERDSERGESSTNVLVIMRIILSSTNVLLLRNVTKS